MGVHTRKRLERAEKKFEKCFNFVVDAQWRITTMLLSVNHGTVYSHVANLWHEYMVFSCTCLHGCGVHITKNTLMYS